MLISEPFIALVREDILSSLCIQATHIMNWTWDKVHLCSGTVRSEAFLPCAFPEDVTKWGIVKCLVILSVAVRERYEWVVELLSILTLCQSLPKTVHRTSSNWVFEIVFDCLVWILLGWVKLILHKCQAMKHLVLYVLKCTGSMEIWTILYLVRLWFILTENLLWLLSNMYSLWLWYAVFKLTRAMQMDKCSIIEFHCSNGTFKFFYHRMHKCFEGCILTHFEGGRLMGIPF